jgi:hypothetical protein
MPPMGSVSSFSAIVVVAPMTTPGCGDLFFIGQTPSPASDMTFNPTSWASISGTQGLGDLAAKFPQDARKIFCNADIKGRRVRPKAAASLGRLCEGGQSRL